MTMMPEEERGQWQKGSLIGQVVKDEIEKKRTEDQSLISWHYANLYNSK